MSAGAVPGGYRQMALGNCLIRLYTAGRGKYARNGAAGRTPQQMVLMKTG